jgi:hypothetical protein
MICEPCATKVNKLGNKIVSYDVKSRKQERQAKLSVNRRSGIVDGTTWLMVLGGTWLIAGLAIATLSNGVMNVGVGLAVIGMLCLIGGGIRRITR